MEQPIVKGCPCDVVHPDLVVACPRLMEILSRTGNAGHNVFRIQTSLQHCNRIHAIVCSQKEPDWEAVAKQACIGMGDEFLDAAKQLCDFVKELPGGVDKHVLKRLETYERRLGVKRKLYPHDLQFISKIDNIEFPNHIIGMIFAMLNSPTECVDATSHATLFGHQDWQSLMRPHGKNRKYAADGHKLYDAFEECIFEPRHEQQEPTVRRGLGKNCHAHPPEECRFDGNI